MRRRGGGRPPAARSKRQLANKQADKPSGECKWAKSCRNPIAVDRSERLCEFHLDRNNLEVQKHYWSKKNLALRKELKAAKAALPLTGNNAGAGGKRVHRPLRQVLDENGSMKGKERWAGLKPEGVCIYSKSCPNPIAIHRSTIFCETHLNLRKRHRTASRHRCLRKLALGKRHGAAEMTLPLAGGSEALRGNGDGSGAAITISDDDEDDHDDYDDEDDCDNEDDCDYEDEDDYDYDDNENDSENGSDNNGEQGTKRGFRIKASCAQYFARHRQKIRDEKLPGVCQSSKSCHSPIAVHRSQFFCEEHLVTVSKPAGVCRYTRTCPNPIAARLFTIYCEVHVERDRLRKAAYNRPSRPRKEREATEMAPALAGSSEGMRGDGDGLGAVVTISDDSDDDYDDEADCDYDDDDYYYDDNGGVHWFPQQVSNENGSENDRNTEREQNTNRAPRVPFQSLTDRSAPGPQEQQGQVLPVRRVLRIYELLN